MRSLSQVVKEKRKLEEAEKMLKSDLEKAMDQYGIKSIDNEFVKVTWVDASTTTSIDLKKLKEKEPDLHEELLEDYPKVTTRKAYVRFTVK